MKAAAVRAAGFRLADAQSVVARKTGFAGWPALDETATPIAIDYLQIDGPHTGAISRGIMEWIGDDVRILMPPAGHPRPDRFDPPPAKGTLSHWRRR